MPEIKVGPLDGLKQVTRISDGVPEPIAIWKLPSGVYATSDTCTHEESSLAEGDLEPEDETIECFLHGAVFEIPTGEVRALPATQPLTVYPASVRDGEVYIEVPTA